ncbi:helix-turn-helix domain-containing protein [Leptospira sp. 2 VSF19]|uniref:Helix-turn-helix domain-containing protein n=1 Tax=Leptospira soteropolitanensis TaxID=2950025 RepID=A0AAW5VHW0_9LEPT|nr:helix-turn-helix domain-containing protein [Leptospira soteropolitanensis]MCW7493587.1 helix-turn-helix domain-containing protein [Leptospira soteropolitanensis]MCW7501186.1 helix-turn-helix domain-containing protein [Leptospira soteropolitanensis]MCW7523628.1 helix-turn-helix domain-containing protein [Leptospira soteropolitanensis]MCW7527299.1 helix-turn-helix domain-containing protein [Leptospira soteropolitanensis]MCW7531156.1 helix-turn-helix domain-containing protein [Leptospira soter
MKVWKPDLSPKEKTLIQSVYVFESNCEEKQTLPFYADGFPGIVFFHSKKPVTVFVGSESKVMDPVFVYGQTIEPIQIEINGPFFFVMLQLFPAVVEFSLDIPVLELTNSCWTIPRFDWNFEPSFSLAIDEFSSSLATRALMNFIIEKGKKFHPDPVLHVCIEEILEKKGSCEIGKLSKKHGLSERTLQRRFQNYVGLTPKQFSTIIRFQFSLNEINTENNSRLTDVAYVSGYSDQSHFIRQFKWFTKKKPFQFREKN